jgi:hypothetical protein
MNDTHTLARCKEVTPITLKNLFDALFEQPTLRSPWQRPPNVTNQ